MCYKIGFWRIIVAAVDRPNLYTGIAKMFRAIPEQLFASITRKQYRIRLKRFYRLLWTHRR